MSTLTTSTVAVDMPAASPAGTPVHAFDDVPPAGVRAADGRRDNGAWFNPTMRAQVKLLRERDSSSIAAIARQLGCSSTTVWTLLNGRRPRRRYPPLDPAQVQRYRDGTESIDDIAAAVGCTTHRARLLLIDAGADVPAAATTDDAERILRDIVARYTTDGQSIRVIAASIGRSYGYVHRRLDNARVPMRSRGGARPKRRTPGTATPPRLDVSSLSSQGGTTDDLP